MGITFEEFFNSYMPWDDYISDKSWISGWTENMTKAKENRKSEGRNGMETFDEFFNIEHQFPEDSKDVGKEVIKAAMTAAEARKKLHESLFGKDEHELADEELDFREEQEIEELEEELECEVKLEKTPDPAKEEIFATCLNFLHNHTEDELYEIVRLAFKAAEVFGY